METCQPGLKEVFDSEISRRLGILFIKTDAVDLGITEEIIAYAAERVEKQGVGKLNGVYLLETLPCELIPMLYPKLSPDGYEIVADYLCEGNCVMATFKGNGSTDMRQLMNQIKGRRMRDWTLEELNGKMGLNDSVRGMLPVPGTTDKYADAMVKLKAQKTNPALRFTDEEFRVYCRNLIHSPDDLQETIGLLNLLSKVQLRENLSPKLLSMYKEINK
jgi:hypothetical protein